MVSLFGRGFDSLQLHMQKKDHLRAAFLSYVEHVTFFYFANAKALHFIPLGVLRTLSQSVLAPIRFLVRNKKFPYF